jgi:hypothetical protein
MIRAIEVILSQTQTKKLAALNEAIHEMCRKGSKGVLYAQVYPDEAYMKVGVMDSEEAIEVGAVITKHIARQKSERGEE